MDYPAIDIQCQMSYEIFPRFFPIHNQGHHFCILGQDSRPLVSGIESQFYLQNRLYLFITLQMEVTVSSIRIIVDSLCSQIIRGPLNLQDIRSKHLSILNAGYDLFLDGIARPIMKYQMKNSIVKLK